VTATPTETATATPTKQAALTPTPGDVVTPDLALGVTWQRPADGMVMVYLPGGTFQMGNSAGDSDEAPVHTVELDPFWLDRTEVTNAKYRRCVADGMCTAPQAPSGMPDDYQNPSQGDHPVVNVNWFQAQAYCSWAGGRLPTEAEWEYAARGPDRPLYPWGESFDCHRGNFDDETERDSYTVTGGQGCDGHNRTAPVESFPAGATWCGAFDIAGNVWEWVLDWYGADYFVRSPRLNPIGPGDGDFRVMRGGGWTSGEWYVRASHRNYDAPGDPNSAVGFRCMTTIAGD
jgi:formylglycine-generating enzyme required for sulfatase activity